MARQIVVLEIEYDPAFEDPPGDWTWGLGVEIDGDKVRLLACCAPDVREVPF